MSFTLKKISVNDIDSIKLFLENAGSSLNTFRYYEKRSFDIISEHVYTVILFDGEMPIGYGHLDDSENSNTVWLGIALAEKYVGKGLGKLLLENLILEANNLNISNIKLSVDSNNVVAICLYEKYRFKKLTEMIPNQKTILMLRKND